jgi:CPA2 family monovalent cation:H+ antiporter-2
VPDLAELVLSDELRFLLDMSVAVVLALVGGAVGVRLGQPPIVGYLLAGVLIGPFTPGYVGDVEEIGHLAELGVILLLFALGVEFSFSELNRVRSVAAPGALLQVALVAAGGTLVALAMGLPFGGAFVLGAAISISSTIVVLKVLADRGELDSLHGRIAIGWMVVQDLVTILLIAILPPLAGGDAVGPIVLAGVRTIAFLVLAYLIGTRVLPWLFGTVSRLGSPELFLLVVFATALVAAFTASAVFGLSLALGAFVAGLIVSESDLSHQAAGEITPFRDLFAVLFFVSVGMLVDPGALLEDLPALLLLLLIVVGGKVVLSAGLGRLLGLPLRSAILLGAAVSQVGEFSFLLAEGALDLDLLDDRGYNLVLGTAVLSIILTPILLRAAVLVADRLEHRPGRLAPPAAGAPSSIRGERALEPDDEERRPAIVVLGAGRVGRVVVQAVRARGFRCIVVDRDQRRLDEMRALGVATLFGDAANAAILRRCGLERARILVVAIGDPLTARLAVERARSVNPRLTVVARARGRQEVTTLLSQGVARVADPEVEAAIELARASLQRMGVSGQELAAVALGLRRRAYGEGRETASSMFAAEGPDAAGESGRPQAPAGS